MLWLKRSKLAKAVEAKEKKAAHSVGLETTVSVSASASDGTALSTQNTTERLFAHDEDLPRMRGFNLWHRCVSLSSSNATHI
jgi:hypothetical protein